MATAPPPKHKSTQTIVFVAFFCVAAAFFLLQRFSSALDFFPMGPTHGDVTTVSSKAGASLPSSDLTASLPPSCDFYLHHTNDVDFSEGRTELWTFPHLDNNSLSDFVALGAFVFSRAESHVVLVASAETMRNIRASGVESRKPVEADYIRRHIKVRYNNRDDISLILSLMIDPTVPGVCSKWTGSCRGMFFDIAIDCLHELGFAVMPDP